MITLCAFIFAAASAIAGLFQISLVLGAPWGHLTMGGKWPGVLPLRARLLAALSASLLALFAMIVLARAGLILPDWASASRKGVWIVVGYCVLGSLANALTPSAAERRRWLPVVLTMGAASSVVALG